MSDMIGRKVMVQGEIFIIKRTATFVDGYYAELLRTGEVLYISHDSIERELD